MLRAIVRGNGSRTLDPTVAGFTRLHTGLIGLVNGSGAPLRAGERHTQPYIGARPSLCVDGSGSLQALGVGGFYMSESGIEMTGPSGVFATKEHGFNGYDPDIAFRIEYYNGRLRTWHDTTIDDDLAFGPIPYVGAQGFSQAHSNPDSGTTQGKFGTIGGALLTRRRDIEFQGMPPGCYVLAYIGALAAIRVDIGDSGAADLPIPHTVRFPISVRYQIHGTLAQGGAVRADLTIKRSYGGDIITYIASRDHSASIPAPVDAFAYPAGLGAIQLDVVADTLAFADGADVTAIVDRSANARDGTMAQLPAPVMMRALFKGKAAFRTSVNGIFTFPRPVQDDWTCYLVGRALVGFGADSERWWANGSLLDMDAGGTQDDSGLSLAASGKLACGGYYYSVTGGPNLIDGAPHVITWTRRKSDGVMTTYVDGVLAATITMDDARRTLGAGTSVFWQRSSFDYARFTFFDTLHDAGQRLAAESALRALFIP